MFLPGLNIQAHSIAIESDKSIFGGSELLGTSDREKFSRKKNELKTFL